MLNYLHAITQAYKSTMFENSDDQNPEKLWAKRVKGGCIGAVLILIIGIIICCFLVAWMLIRLFF
jgi:hypothetical protein